MAKVIENKIMNNHDETFYQKAFYIIMEYNDPTYVCYHTFL